MIAAHREAAGHTQTALAALIPITQGALSNIERGHKTPSAATLARIVVLLDLTDQQAAEILRSYTSQ